MQNKANSRRLRAGRLKVELRTRRKRLAASLRAGAILQNKAKLGSDGVCGEDSSGEPGGLARERDLAVCRGLPQRRQVGVGDHGEREALLRRDVR